MNRSDFIDLLKSKDYAHKVKGAKIVVTHGGYVSLPRVTTLPKGVTFENDGSVDLLSVTTLPEGVSFENDGYVYLPRVTTLPEGVTFRNGGYVYLYSVTALLEGVTFENGGYVYLYSVTGKQPYQGKEREFRHVDGLTMLFTSSKSSGGYTVHSARYFGGGAISKLRKCYVAECDGVYAHGNSMKSAVEDLQYKMADRADKAEIVDAIRKSGKVTLSQFRALTGACREGVRQHLNTHGIDLDAIDDMPLVEALKAMAGTSYGEAFSKYVEAGQ